MNTPTRTIQEIAHDALEDLESAQIVMGKLESLLYAALADKSMSPHIRNLIDIGWSLVADGANTADCNREAISWALGDTAPAAAGGGQ